jgi:hypothetical protein
MTLADDLKLQIAQLRGITDALDKTISLLNLQSSDLQKVRVTPGTDLQKQYDSVNNGTELRLAPGLYTTNLKIRASKSNVIIRSDVDDSILASGMGVKWLDSKKIASQIARLVPADASQPIISCEDQSHEHSFIGLEIGPNVNLPDRNLVILGDGIRLLENVPYKIDFDRCYIHGDLAKGGRRGILLGSKDTKITGCYLSNFVFQGQDSQAIGGYNGPGPYVIEDNYIEASGENILFGGADPSIPNLIPSNIVIRGNYVFKPLEWKLKSGSVKNLFELKNAQRVLIENNVFENVWADSQAGSAIVLTVRNQDGAGPWSTVQDVIFQFNVVRNVGNYMFNLLGKDDSPGKDSVQGRNLFIQNNLGLGIHAGLQVLGGGYWPTTVSHNTLLDIVTSFLSLSITPPMQSGTLKFKDNVLQGGVYGLHADDTGVGTPSLERGSPGAEFTNNVIEGNVERQINYPPNNYPIEVGKLASLLDPHRRYIGPEKSSDGKMLGVDIDSLMQRIPWYTL